MNQQQASNTFDLWLASNLRVGAYRNVRFIGFLAATAVVLFIAYIARLNAITHDVFHEMALAREWFQAGSFPLTDRFAYTPTVAPAVHHEWGTGVLLYWVGPASPLGLNGIMALRILLVLALGLLIYRVARLQGAHPYLIFFFLPIVLPILWVGFATLRAQLFTLVAIAAQMLMLQSDWRGGKRWIYLWIPMYIVWLNLHAGFVVGLGMLAFHTLERIYDVWKRCGSYAKELGHLAFLIPVSLVGLSCNPWGWEYVPYLVRAITMERPTILEWKPLWATHDASTTLFVFAISVAMLGYVAKVRHWRRLRGWFFCAVTAYMALKHIRHGSIYGVVWLATVPAWVTPTPFGQSLIAWIQRSQVGIQRVGSGLIVACSLFAIVNGFWNVTIPSSLAASSFCMPTGVVETMRSHRVQGNVMTPFHCGAYLSWELYPDIRVSIDGRYEVAYAPEVLPDHLLFYEAQPGWEAILQKYDHDFVIIPRDAAVAKPMMDRSVAAKLGWEQIYSDESFLLFGRESLD